MGLNKLSQSEWFTTYLEYESLKEMLNVILYTSQSFMAILPQLHYITYRDKEILFHPYWFSRWYCCSLSCSKGKAKQEIRGTE
jgi:hypothetical protein